MSKPIVTSDGEVVGYSPGGATSRVDAMEASLRRTFDKCLGIALEKNARYAGGEDPFRNFRLGGEYGIAIRMSDKVVRLLTLLHPTNRTSDGGESIEDTCHDLVNYAALLVAMREDR